MSARSPRGSFSGASTSAEVAADFEESLNDLQSNNRHEITNLTIIAKENTEHAQAISRAIENHIKKTSPTRKLPALFVLDSIVKNVGTPYTVYLGRNLFSTFMDAYTLVDSNTRRNMKGMLKTWKEPVPGSIDPRPVFPPETVRPIENALLKAETVALQSSQRQPHRGTATPPQHNGQFPPPQNRPTSQPFGVYGNQQPTQQQHYPYAVPPQLPLDDINAVKRDIEGLISRIHQQLAMNPHDGSRNQLGALQALHGYISTRGVNASELHEIRNQVSRLSAPAPSQLQATPQPPVPTPQWQQHPMQLSQPSQPPQPALPTTNPFPSQPAAAPTLSPDTVSGLQALLANTQKPSTPQMRAAIPGFRDASHSQLHAIQNHAAAPPSNNPAELLASLAKAGFVNLGTSSTPVPTSAPAVGVAPPIDATASLLQSLKSVLPPISQTGTPSYIPAQPVAGAASVPGSAASLKVFRPELVYALYDAQSSQCNTCGRRFLATDEGREKKSRHLDWHFRMNQRIADPNTNRGHHRNWFVDEMEWIRHADFDPSTTTATATDTEAAAKAKKGPEDQVVRAPAGMTKNTCNICFEEMKSSYSEDLQDWIFANATWYNGKIVHATCLAEMTKPQLGGKGGGSLAAALATVGGGGGQRERSATPDSALGKRKAQTAMAGAGARLRTQ